MNGRANARQAFAEYLNLPKSPKRARSVIQVGWHTFGGRRVFVLPDANYGEADERVVLLKTADQEPSLFQSKGTLDGWRAKVSRLCAGNSRLLFAASCGFAAPLLHLVGQDSGGFNFRGISRAGKTTALRVAGSVCGGTEADGASGFIRQWRATGNALEAVAATSCDSLLLLDEMSQAEDEIGETAYMLANGQGKARAGRNGQARPIIRFRVLFLSTGEVSLADMNAQAGKVTKAGQQVRLVDIPADAGAGMGLFEDLHDEGGAGVFADELQVAVHENYGTALHAFLRYITEALARDGAGFVDGLRASIDTLVSRWLADIPGAGGQVRSVARRFALVAIAGEMARQALITEWAEGAAERGAETCFRAWLAERGTAGAQEEAQAVKQLRAYIQKHQDSRLLTWEDHSTTGAQEEADPNAPPSQRFRTMNAAGWRRWETFEGERKRWRVYLMPDAMDEALEGLPKQEARQALVDRGHIVMPTSGADAKRKNKAGLYTVPGYGKVRLYKIGDGLLASEEGDA